MKIIGFDFDGTLVESWTATPLPGVRERLAALPPDTKTFIATNQAGPVWRQMTGETKYPTCDDVADHIIGGLAALGWRPDFLFVATHAGVFLDQFPWDVAARDAITPLYDRLEHVCWCSVSALIDDRKPRPGMLRSAVLECDDHTADLLLYIGDMQTDAEAAMAAGFRYLDAAVWREKGVS